MSKIHITTLPEGKLGIIRMRDCNAADEPVILAKTLFELSRDPDNMSQHFDPVIHTLGAISGGLTGHCVITCRECDDTELPPETTFRNAWEDTGGRRPSQHDYCPAPPHGHDSGSSKCRARQTGSNVYAGGGARR